MVVNEADLVEMAAETAASGAGAEAAPLVEGRGGIGPGARLGGARLDVAMLRHVPDVSAGGRAAVDAVLVELLAAWGLLGDAPADDGRAIGDLFLRCFCAEVLPGLCAAVKLQGQAVAVMTTADCQAGGRGLPLVAALCQRATALWLLLAPMAGGGGLDMLSAKTEERLIRAAGPFRAAFMAQLTRAGDVLGAIRSLCRAFLAADAIGADSTTSSKDTADGDAAALPSSEPPADAAESPLDARLAIAVPLAGILRACYQWPEADASRPRASVWKQDSLVALRALVRILSLSVPTLERAARTPAAATTTSVVDAESVRMMHGAPLSSSSDESAVAAFRERAALCVGPLAVEALVAAIEDLSSAPAMLDLALGQPPQGVSGLALVIQSALHGHLQARRRAPAPVRLESSARIAAALSAAVSCLRAQRLPDTCAAAFVAARPVVTRGSDAGDWRSLTGGSVIEWPATAGARDDEAAERRMSVATTALCGRSRPPSNLPLFISDLTSRPDDTSSASASATGSAMAASRDRMAATLWIRVSDFLEAGDCLRLGRTCRPLALLFLHTDALTDEVRLPVFVAGGKDGTAVGRAGVVDVTIPDALAAAARGLCAQARVRPPPEASGSTTAPSPATVATEQSSGPLRTSPFARLVWSRRVARRILASPERTGFSAPASVAEALNIAVRDLGADPPIAAEFESVWPIVAGDVVIGGASTTVDMASLLTAPARDLRAAPAGILGGVSEMCARAVDTADACIAKLAPVLRSAKDRDATGQALRKPMSDASAALAAAAELAAGVSSHLGLLEELFRRRAAHAAAMETGSSASTAASAHVDDPLAVLRAIAMIAQMWPNRRLRGDPSRLPPAVRVTDAESMRSYLGAAALLFGRLMPALGDAEAPVEHQGPLFVACENHLRSGRMWHGFVGHPALAAAVTILNLTAVMKVCAASEVRWALLDASVGVALVPALGKRDPKLLTTDTLISAITASVVLECDLLRQAGARYFAEKPAPRQRHPLISALQVYLLAADALSTLLRVSDPDASRESFAAECRPLTRISLAREQLLLCLSNAAECLLRLGQNSTAARYAAAALTIDPTHEKSLRRLERASTGGE